MDDQNKNENIFVALRNKLEEFIHGTNNIAQLMKDKVNPYVLIEEVPAPVQIGRHIIWVGNFTIENNYKFWMGYGKILALSGIKFEGFDLIASGGELYKALTIHKRLYKDLCKLIRNTICKQQGYYLEQMPEETRRKFARWRNMSVKYLTRHMSTEKLLQVCKLIYLYNFDPEKKNLAVTMFQLPNSGKETMRTYMATYLENITGVTGNFQRLHSIKPSVLSSGETLQMGRMAPGGMGNEPKKQRGTGKADSKRPILKGTGGEGGRNKNEKPESIPKG